jgi:hypothetical protein
MTEREQIIQQIIDLETHKANLARRALACESAGEYELADALDAKWNKASNKIGRLMRQIDEVDRAESAVSRIEHIRDVSYGRML